MSAATSDSVRRFDLAVQTSHLGVFTIAFIVALVGRGLGVFALSLKWAIAGWRMSSAAPLFFRELFKRGVDRRLFNPMWMTAALAWHTIAVPGTAGRTVPYF